MDTATSNATPQTRQQIPRTLPILARLEDERTQLELALEAFRDELAAQALGLNAA